MISMTGRSKITLFNTVVIFFVNITLSYILIPKYGIIGAAVATGISFSLINILRVLEVYLILRIHPYRIDFLKPLASAGISVIVIYVVKYFLLSNINNFVMLAVGSLIFLGSYGLFYFLLGIKEEEKIIIEKIRAKLNK